MANLFLLPFRPAYDSNLKAIPGAQAWFTLSGTNTPSAPYTDEALTVPHANPVIANGFGRFPTIWLDEDLSYRLRIYEADAEVGVDDPVEEYDPYVADVIVDGAIPRVTVVDTMADLTALTPYENGKVVFVRERGLQFEFDDTDLSDDVAGDAAQGFLAAPDAAPDGATGAWRAKFYGRFDPMWFGFVEGDAAGANGAANSAAWEAMWATLQARAYNPLTFNQGLDAIRFPGGYFEFAETIEITDGSTVLEGASVGGVNTGGAATVFKFAAGVTGIRVQRYNTSGDTDEDDPTHMGGNGSIIRNIALHGGYSGTEAEFHGIQLRGKAAVDNVFIKQFEGDGIYSFATAGGTPEGNANNCFITNTRIQECRRGVFVDGADVNIWTLINVDCSSNRQWGFFDSSFLGNTYIGCHASTNGLVTGATPTVVTNGGNRYGVIVGQEVGASTNAPSGTATDNTWWYYISAGGASPSNNIAEWLTGTTYRAGGSYLTDNTAATNLLSGCYHENGQGLAQLTRPTFVNGGQLAGSVYGDAAQIYTDVTGSASTKRAFKAVFGTKFAQLGDANATSILAFGDPSQTDTGTYRLKRSGQDFRWDYNNGGTTVPFIITGNATTLQFGTGAAVPNCLFAARFALPSSLGGSSSTGKPVFRAAVSSATYAAPTVTYSAPATTYVAPAGGATVDTEARASLAQLATDVGATNAKLAAAAVDTVATNTKLAALAADLADMKAKLQAAGLMS